MGSGGDGDINLYNKRVIEVMHGSFQKYVCETIPDKVPNWVFLDTSQSWIRWNAARGFVAPAKSVDARIPSAFLISRLKRGPKFFNLEARLENRRLKNWPHAVSRLEGLFSFETRADAERAASLWFGYFQTACLTDVGLSLDCTISRHDSNWITYHALSEEAQSDESWMDLYWGGTAYPLQEPLWEILTDKSMSIWNYELRQECYERFEQSLKCLFLLRLSILAAFCGYDIGTFLNQIRQTDNCIIVYGTIKFDENEAIEAWEVVKKRFPEESKAIHFYSEKTLFVLPDSTDDDYCLVHHCHPSKCEV